MAVKLLNDVRSKLAVSISSTDTQVRVIAGHGVRFPVLSSGDWFPLAIENENGEIEYMKATARTGDMITVERGLEGSVARGYQSGALVELRLTVAALDARIEQIVVSKGGTANNMTTADLADGSLVD